MKNTQQDHELAEKIAGLLEGGTQQIDAATTAKLLQVRKQALAHFNEQPEPRRLWVLSWAAQGMARVSEPFSHNLRALGVLAALLVSLAGAIAWHSYSTQGSEIADIDEGLLTSELPINAYLDRSIDSWLKRP